MNVLAWIRSLEPRLGTKIDSLIIKDKKDLKEHFTLLNLKELHQNIFGEEVDFTTSKFSNILLMRQQEPQNQSKWLPDESILRTSLGRMLNKVVFTHNTKATEDCKECKTPGSTEHYMNHCKLYAAERRKII